ncbi:MAG: hypothetical protein H7Y30_03845, partial [Pyrinomonadaceae bacterium]|nr:hypothetical protein [Pyrinomonadaceae bacterium]
MKTRTRSRLIVGGLLALALATFAGIKTNSQSATASAQSATAARAATRLIAHEWGTFTSVAGKDGVMLEWRPLSGPSDLPKFVHTISSDGLRRGVSKGSISASVRMGTPVIYFYADRETEVSVKVDFPKGKITEWYPHARTSAGASIDWGKFKILPGASFNFPKESALSHYYPARETDAAPVQVCGVNGKENEQEKFLFYRGVGSFDLPLSVKLEADQVVLKNLAQPEISNLVIFENRGGKIGYRLCDAFTGEMTHERPALTQNMDALLADLERILIAEGLYQKEERSMIQTWRDSWFVEGLRVF